MKGKNSPAIFNTVFLSFVFAFICGISYGQQNTLRVHVLEFTFVDSLSFPKTVIEIDSFLEKSLSSYDQIDIISSENQINASQIDSLRNGLTVSGISGVDIIIFGKYIVENRYVNIQPYIYDVEMKRFYSQSLSRGIINEVSGVIDRVSSNIIDKLMEISPVMRQSFNKVVFLSNFQQVPGSSRKVIGEINSLSELYTKQLIEYVDYDGIDYTEIIPWSQVIKYDQSRKMIVDSIKPDLIITLTFVFDSLTAVSLKTEFLVYKKNSDDLMIFNLPDLKADHYKSSNINFQDFIRNEMVQFLYHVIDQDGRLDGGSFIQLKSTGPSDISYMNKAEKLIKNRDYYPANLCYYNALNNEDNTVKVFDIYLQLGFNKVYMFRLDEANEEFDFVLANDPGNGYAYVGKSLISFFSTDGESTLTNYDDAKNMLEIAKKNGLDNKLVYEGLMGYYNFGTDDYQEALLNFDKAAKADRSVFKFRIGEKLSIEALRIHQGLCYIGLEQFDEAITFYKALNLEFSTNRDIPYYLGIAYSSRGIDKYFKKDYEGAIADLQASKQNYADPDIDDYIRLSMIYLGNNDQATLFIQEEIEKGTYDASFIWKRHARDLWKMMADDAAKTGAYNASIVNEVIKNLERSLLVYDNDPRALFWLGEIYPLLDNNQKGFEYMRQAVETDPLDFELRIGLMQAYLLTGNYDACMTEYKLMSRRKNREFLNGRNNVLMEFFNVSAKLASGEKAKKEINRIEKELTEDVAISNWTFRPYEKWLKNSPCSPEALDSLESILSRLKATTDS